MFGVTTYGKPGQAVHRYYKCHGKDTVTRDRACRCTQTPAKVEELDAAVWGHVKALLEDPAALASRFEELARLSESKDDGRAAAQRWEAQLQRLGREEQRLVDAYQAEVIDLEELKARREQIQGRRQVLVTQRDQEQRLQVERQAAKAVWSDLEAFCRRVRSRLDEASFAERQRILQLLIERVIVGEDSLEIRHVIPLGQAGGDSSGPGPEGSPGSGDGEGRGPEEEPGPRPICRLRSDGVELAPLPGHARQPGVQRRLEPAVGVAHDQLHPVQAPGLQRPPGSPASGPRPPTARRATPSTDRFPSGSMPMATRTAHERTWPPWRTFS